MKQADLIAPTEDHDRMRAFEVDRTPLRVAEQGADAALKALGRLPDSVLLPAAGDGVFAKSLRGDPFIVGVEPRQEDISDLARWVDRPMNMTFEDYVAEHDDRFDLILDNPAFSLLPTLLKHADSLLRPGGVMTLYGLSTWGHSYEPSECGDIWDTWAPSFQHRVHGRVRHRLGINPRTGRKYDTDSRKYSFWSWRKGQNGFENTGVTYMTTLPPLSKAERTVAPRET